MSGTRGLYVVTGGPGAGKSALIEALGARGLATVEEAGRAVIRQQVAIGGRALPWADRALFAELMLSWDLRAYAAAAGGPERPVLFDRGVPDVLGYLTLSGLAVPPHLAAAAEACRYARTVFVAPPWEAIFGQDAERRQDFSEAVRTCDSVSAAYAGLGYELVELPKATVEDRAAFVTARIAGG